jgi:type II secretory pathway pseudopilin PulG
MHDLGTTRRRGEEGFTLIESLIAMVILITGIAAIANLMVIAGSSNAVGSHTTAAAMVASQQMELLKSATYPSLIPGGTVVIPPNHGGPAHPQCNLAPVQGMYACDTTVEGVGLIHVQWSITGLAAAPTTYFIHVVSRPVAASTGQRALADFTTFRTSN